MEPVACCRNGVGDRLAREGFEHEGTFIAAAGRKFRIDFKRHTQKSYGIWSTELTADLYRARDRAGLTPYAM